MAVIWVIILFIATLAASGAWYVANGDIARFSAEAVAAKTELQEFEGRFDALAASYQELSNLVGYRDTNVVTSKSDVVAIQTEIDGIKAALGSAAGGADTKLTLATAVSALRAAQQSAAQAVAATRADHEREVAARQAAESSANSVQTNFQSQLTALNTQLRDERQRADNQSAADSRRFDELVASQQSADAAARQAQQALASFEVQARRESSTAAATIKALALRREPVEPDGADGAILAVASQGDVAFIDIGGRHGLRRGTRFDVLRPGKGGELQPRGTVEVREVESDMAMVGLLGAADPFDPILPGDVVRNPHFEKGRTLRFHLLGDFPLSLSKEFATQRLRELGAEVDETLGTTTDVLVLGDKSLADGEFAIELTETDAYKQADRLGMRIIRLADLIAFLRY